MKRLYPYFILFCISNLTYAQVGINTTNPDPSSILDITSTTGGMLAPRMTTAQRLAIPDPAEGLTVYDIEEFNLFIFSNSAWVEQGTAKRRINYKLIQKPEDLSEELIAGGGAKYLLDSNFLYEINGTIPIAFPIDLNDAKVLGMDAFSDVLLNTSGSTLIQSTAGGILRDVTLRGNGFEIFDISGDASDIFFTNDCILTGASKVGSISGIGTVYLGVSQFSSNENGLSLSNVDSFFMFNTFWTSSNSGTFLELTGSFNNLQLTNGRIISELGETGIDVGSNPIIVNDATLTSLSFVGDGTKINPYTTNTYDGYNFNSNWNVNCSGIPVETDAHSTGNFYSTSPLTSGFSQSISNTTAREIQGSSSTFDNTELFRFSASGGNNRLVYEGKKTSGFQINASLSVRVREAAGNFYSFLIAKNGALVIDSDSLVLIEKNAQIQSVSINTAVTLAPGDYIEIFVKRLTGSGTDILEVYSENLSIR